jgi:hypothetical protein
VNAFQSSSFANAGAASSRLAALLNQKTLRSVELHDIQPVFGPDFVLHAVQMVLYGLLGKREMIGDLFVRQALRNQRNQLLLPPRQA